MTQVLEVQLLSRIFDALVAVRTEIILFCIAFACHYALFRKTRTTHKASNKKDKISHESFASYEADKDTARSSVHLQACKDPSEVLERSRAAFDRGDHRSVLKCWNLGNSAELKSSNVVPAAHLAQIVESMQRFKKDSKSILSEITSYLMRDENHCMASLTYMRTLLEPLSKSLDIELVEGIVNLLPRLGLQADGHIFEILVHMRFATRSFDDVSALAKQMSTEGVAPTSRARVMLLKTALQTEKLDEALLHYRAITTSAGVLSSTASEAPVHIAVQLVELACRLHCPEAVLSDLESHKMPLTTEMINALLSECTRARKPELAARVEKLAIGSSVGKDGRTYQALVRNAATDPAKLAALLDDMAANSIPCTTELGNTVLAACMKSGDVAIADRLYSLLGSNPQGQAPTLQALLRFYAEAGRPEKACDLFAKHLQGIGDRNALLDARTERSLVSAALQCNRQDVASAVLESSPADTAKHIDIIRGCVARGNLREAMGAFRSLQNNGAELTSSLCNAALDACVECRDLDQAKSLMKEIEDGGLADAVTYNTLIKGHLRHDNAQAARGVMVTMRKAGCAPNHVTYNELINALVRNDRDASRGMQAVWDLVDEMKAGGVVPNRITCSILLKSLKAKSSSTDISKALKLTEQMQEPIDEVLMSSIVEALVRVGKPGLLSQKLNDLNKINIRITGAHTFGSLIKAYGHANDIAGAWRCWKEMRSRHVRPTSVTIGCMVEAVASSGDVDGAYELICQLLEDDQCKDQVNAVIFGSVLKGYGRSHHMERVWSVFEDLLSHNIQPSISTFNVVIDACARSGRMDAVPKLLKDMAEWSIWPNLITYSTMIKGFSQHADMPAALATLRDLNNTRGLKPDGIVYNTVLEGCAQAGLVVEGERLFNEMQEAGVAPTNYTLTVMVRLLSHARRADQAFELVETLTHKHRFRANSHVLGALIQASLVSRDTQRAAQVFEQMAFECQLPDVRTRQSLVRGLISAGSTKLAAKVMRTMLQVTAQPGKEPQSHWSPQDDVLLSEVLCALATSTSDAESARLGKQLLADVHSYYPKVCVDPLVQNKVQVS